MEVIAPSTYRRLDGERVLTTITKLCQRIAERFPQSGLRGVGRELESLASRARSAAPDLAKLRSVVHIVDMHQLTKDPEILLDDHVCTASSPERTMNRFELARDLDDCSEMLSLAGKVAALYLQYMDDPVVISAVTEVETLATGISGKIWQKIVILDTVGQG